MTTLEEFITEVCQRPLPQNPMARVRTLAKELAEGAAERIWDSSQGLQGDPNRAFSLQDIDSDSIKAYLRSRWNTKSDEIPTVNLLIDSGFLDWDTFIGGGTTVVRGFKIASKAFDLLEETEPSTIFISYRRSESSPFALLVLARLKQAGLEPFLDMALEPGEDWHAGLKERIQSRDFFILLLGKTTLQSPYVIKEMEWALEKDLAILPIWQPDFEFNAAEWPDLPDAVKHKLSNTHRIKVQEENPLEYDKALTELLNRFGITP